jgi:hypothetical protein
MNTKENCDKCEDCGRLISFGVWEYSLNKFGRSLCEKCQCEERLKTYPVKLANYINKARGY